jgi:hypothetical protein
MKSAATTRRSQDIESEPGALHTGRNIITTCFLRAEATTLTKRSSQDGCNMTLTVAGCCSEPAHFAPARFNSQPAFSPLTDTSSREMLSTQLQCDTDTGKMLFAAGTLRTTRMQFTACFISTEAILPAVSQSQDGCNVTPTVIRGCSDGALDAGRIQFTSCFFSAKAALPDNRCSPLGAR